MSEPSLGHPMVGRSGRVAASLARLDPHCLGERMNEPTSIRLPQELKKRLQKEATKRYWSLSRMIIAILEKWKGSHREDSADHHDDPSA